MSSFIHTLVENNSQAFIRMDVRSFIRWFVRAPASCRMPVGLNAHGNKCSCQPALHVRTALVNGALPRTCCTATVLHYEQCE